MDLTAAISALQSNKVLNQVDTAVAMKVLSSQKQQGETAISLLQSATGQSDSLAVAATGLGGSIDAYA